MAVTVRIPTQLRELSGGAAEVPVEGGDASPRCSKALDAAHPGFGERLFDEHGRAAPLRERVRRRRGHPLPRRHRHRRSTDGADREHRPRRRRRLAHPAATRTCVEVAVIRRNFDAGTVRSGGDGVDELGELAGDGLLARRAGELHALGAGARPRRRRSPGSARRRRGTRWRRRRSRAFSLMRRTITGPGLHLGERHRRRAFDLVRRSRGSGCRAGRSRGRRGAATSFSSTSAEIACSQRSASLCTFSHSSPMMSTSRRSARRCRRTIEVATSRPLVVRRRLRSSMQLGVAVVDEAVDRLRDRGGRQPEPLDEAGADRDRALLLDLEDGFEVLLGGVVPLGHARAPRRQDGPTLLPVRRDSDGQDDSCEAVIVAGSRSCVRHVLEEHGGVAPVDHTVVGRQRHRQCGRGDDAVTVDHRADAHRAEAEDRDLRAGGRSAWRSGRPRCRSW